MLHLFKNVLNRFRLLLSRRTESPESPPSKWAISPDDEISEAIVHAFSHGSEPAFRQIYDRYAPAIYRVVQRYFQSSALAEELVEELFCTLWHERGMYTGVAQLRQRLFTMARDLAIHYLEKMTVEMLSVSHTQHGNSEQSPVAKPAGLPINVLQHQLKNVRQPQV